MTEQTPLEPKPPHDLTGRELMDARRQFKPSGLKNNVDLKLPEPAAAPSEAGDNVIDLGRERAVQALANHGVAETVEVKQIVPGAETTSTSRPNLTLIKDEFRWGDVKPEDQTHLIAAAENVAAVNERGNTWEQIDAQNRPEENNQQRTTA